MSVVLHGCEIRSLTLREERGLKVFQNDVLRRIFGPRRDEVTGKWRKQYNIRVIKSRRMRWEGYAARMGRVEVCRGLWRRNLRERDHL